MNEQITAEEFKNIALNAIEAEKNIEWNGVSINIKKTIDFAAMESFVKYVMDVCFIDNEFHPELKDFAVRCATINYYTDIPLSDNINDIYSLLYGNDLLINIKLHIDNDQLSSMVSAINKTIDYKISVEVADARNKLDGVVSQMSELEKSFSDAFVGIDNSTIQKIASSISNGEFDSEKLVKSFLDTKYEQKTE